MREAGGDQALGSNVTLLSTLVCRIFFFSIIGINEGKTLCLREVFEMKVSFGGWDKNKGKIILCSWTDNVHIIYLFFFSFSRSF